MKVGQKWDVINPRKGDFYTEMKPYKVTLTLEMAGNTDDDCHEQLEEIFSDIVPSLENIKVVKIEKLR